MSKIRYWYRPKSPWIEILETEENPCGCCKNLATFTRKHWPYHPSKGNTVYSLDISHKDINSRLKGSGWEELK